ncbi:glycosyltransferase family 2 protein [Culicoidibacter larvae]|uniref:Glycosyltransferase n=1 Tax=Culicoidibacter larvae TaxID=2579976 RepID=A0A5R8QC75_9FIRM|nr:glycosyltransferase family 2 protein [Culicoidibacter larvae]TLG72928.1 glycosyltransferase [Culicoidibacter larvae]
MYSLMFILSGVKGDIVGVLSNPDTTFQSIGWILVNGLNLLFNVAMYAVNTFMLLFMIYIAVLTLIGFKKIKRNYEIVAPKKSFLVLVPAHNEESVIAGIVDNLNNNMDYPRELFDIYVIADNCNDRTAEIAREHGAGVVEHTSPPGEPKGKPYGIRYALKELDGIINNYDNVAFFDADNLVATNFFTEMNSQFLSDDSIKVSQAYLDCKNPDDSYVSIGYAAGYYQTNRFFQNAKNTLGLTPAIGGTGFTVDRLALQEIGWTADSLTEDFEFQVQCVSEGYRSVWNHFTAVYDEKPTEAKQSIIQRLRWARGHWSIHRKYFGQLMRRFKDSKKLTGKRDWNALDTGVYTLLPLIAGASPFLMVINGLLGNTQIVWIAAMMMVMAIGSVILAKFAMKRDTIVTTNYNIFKILFGMMWFSFTFIGIYIAGILTYKNREWVRTEHRSQVNIDSLVTK